MIYSIGEALIDMIPQQVGKSIRYVDGFSKQAGGAPANVAATIAKLGGNSAFVSKVGSDGFGRYIVDVLNNVGVDTSKVFYSDNKFTGIIYIATKEDGDREFCASRQNSADLYLDRNEIDEAWFTNKDILHFCSVSLVEAPVKYAHIKAIESIIAKGGRVSFDVNLRLMLWEKKEDCIKTVWDFIKYPDYLKVSDDEVEIILNTNDYDMAVKQFFKAGKRLKFIIVSRGKDGSYIFFRNGIKHFVPAYSVNVVDTTGAGDCFIGSILYHLDNISCEPNEKDMLKILNFASAAAALEIGKIGAITSLPTLEEVINYLKVNSKDIY